MISEIPEFRSDDRNLYGIDSEFIRNKLLQSEENPNIVRLSRGEGRRQLLEVIGDSMLLFDWGAKSNHSFRYPSNMRDLLDPGHISMEQLINLINLLSTTIEKHRRKIGSPVKGNIDFEVFQRLIESASENELIIIKEFICFVLHTAGNVPGFNVVTPWISTSCSDMRYNTARFFGQRNKKYAILDYWVAKSENGISYRRTSEIIDVLSRFGIEWYPDNHHEVMVKYALFPHQLIGYYLYEDSRIQYYYVNPHYLTKWKLDTNFQIGDYLNIPQEHVDFPVGDHNPYQIIYEKSGYHIGVFKKRT